MCSLWQESGCGSFIKMLSRRMDNGRTVRPAVLSMLNCVSLSSLSAAFFLYPLHLCLIFWNIHRTWMSLKTTNPQGQTHFLFYLPSLVYSPCSFVFFISFFQSLCVVVSVLFKFNLNTLQLWMNQAIINLIMLRHATITALQHKCVWEYGITHIQNTVSKYRIFVFKMQLKKLKFF